MITRRGVLTFIFAVLGAGSQAMSANYVAGHYYMPIDGGTVIEYNGSLDEVRRFQVAGVTSATGAVMNQQGNLTFVGRRLGTTRVIEVNADGAILHEYDTGNGSLLRGSYIDQRTDGMFAFANEHVVTVLDSNLSPVGSSGAVFQRASGIAFDTDGTFLATDQFSSGLKRFSITGSSVSLVGFVTYNASTPTGIDIGPAGGVLFGTQFGTGELDRVSLQIGGTTTPLVTGQGFGGFTDVRQLSDGTLLTVRSGTSLRLYSATGQLLDSSVDAGNTGDSVAVFVPSPGAALLLLLGAMGLRRRPRYTHL